MGSFCPFLFCMGADCAHFLVFGEIFMKKHTRKLAHAAIIAALYAVLTHFQNILLPGSATWAIQMRLSEALCILAFFTPAAAMGLAVGCLVFNLTFAAALPLDFLVGTIATYLACKTMWLTRNVKVKNISLLHLVQICKKPRSSKTTMGRQRGMRSFSPDGKTGSLYMAAALR